MPNPVYVALDIPQLDAAKALAQQVRAHVGGFKLGMEFFYAHGPIGVRTIADLGLPLFLDLKLYDIPNTVAGGIRSLMELSPSILTIHAGGGQPMMEAAKSAAGPDTKVVAVTMLTSMDQTDLTATGVTGSSKDHVLRLAALAERSGIDGIVCSGQEVGLVKRQWDNGFFVVPGLRPAGSDAGDQKRVVTPVEARNDGARVLVIGRPITAAQDPVAAAEAIFASL